MAYVSETKEWVRAKIVTIVKNKLQGVSEMDCYFIDFGILKRIKADK